MNPPVHLEFTLQLKMTETKQIIFFDFKSETDCFKPSFMKLLQYSRFSCKRFKIAGLFRIEPCCIVSNCEGFTH